MGVGMTTLLITIATLTAVSIISALKPRRRQSAHGFKVLN